MEDGVTGLMMVSSGAFPSQALKIIIGLETKVVFHQSGSVNDPGYRPIQSTLSDADWARLEPVLRSICGDVEQVEAPSAMGGSTTRFVSTRSYGEVVFGREGSGPAARFVNVSSADLQRARAALPPVPDSPRPSQAPAASD